jgi:predicted transcriptional regulator
LANGALGANFNSAHNSFTLFKSNRQLNNKMLRRGKLDIVAEILRFCEQQKTKTSIMYNTNLNYAQLKRHMELLVGQGLLAKDSNKFSTTEKGHRFLSLFGELNELIEQI